MSAIEAVLGKDCVVAQDRRTSLADSLHWDEPIELFPWLMILVLLVLAVENLLANKFYGRKPMVQNDVNSGDKPLTNTVRYGSKAGIEV